MWTLSTELLKAAEPVLKAMTAAPEGLSALFVRVIMFFQQSSALQWPPAASPHPSWPVPGPCPKSRVLGSLIPPLCPLGVKTSESLVWRDFKGLLSDLL